MAKKNRVQVSGTLGEHKSTKKKDVIKLHVDFSPRGFLTKAAGRKQPVAVCLRVEDRSVGIEPLAISGRLKGCTLQLEELVIPDERLADLRFLCHEETALKVTLEAAGPDEEFPAMDCNGSED